MKLKRAVAATIIVLAAAITGVQAPAQASISGCLLDSSPGWEFNPETGNFKSDVHRTTGCGEATILPQYILNTTNTCGWWRVRIMDADGNTLREGNWHDHFLCKMPQYETLMSGIGEGRRIRLEFRHSDQFLRAAKYQPITWFYF